MRVEVFKNGETPMLVASGFRISLDYLVGKTENLFMQKAGFNPTNSLVGN